jgi:Tol biopolymer transport system component/DNA-binding winged helix-turn-helix (wHTH) protein
MEGRGERMTYRFDDVEVDADAFRVTKAGEAVRLEPKAIELLLFLAKNPGRLVTKAETQEAVWPDTCVTENALTRLVAQIRKGLGDGVREARYIETVPTRGYRFVAPLERGDGAPDSVPAKAADGGLASRTPSRGAKPRWGPRPRAAAVTALLAIALVGLFRNRTVRPPSASMPTATARALERQVSTSATLNVFPRFSPDGSTIAFATLRRGSMEIVVRALALGARETAITSDGMQNVQPAFSPDGRLLAYHSVGRGGIWLAPSLGGVPRQLTLFGSSPAWSPDGSQLAFQGQSWVGSHAGFSSAGEGSTIWVVPASGGPPRPLTTIQTVGPGGQGRPAWSPDGRLISFVSGDRVVAMRADGTGLRPASGEVWCRDVEWEKGGRSQLWTGSRTGNWFVWRVPVHPDTGVQSGEPEVLASGGEKASAWSHPAVSPDGRSVAYVTFRTRYELLSQSVTSSGEPTGEAVTLVGGIAGRKTPPLFSPDGRRLAFGTLRPGEGRSLWAVDLDSGEPRLLTEQSGLAWSRSWFPDSRHLGFMSGGWSERRFSSVDVETGSLREHRRLEPHIASCPALAPDGARLVAHGAHEGRLAVWAMDLAGGPARLIANDAEGVGWPAWSPDGKTLAVELMRGGDTRIGVMAAAGDPVREIVSKAGQSWPHSFSPDGRRIAYAGQRGGVWNVYWVPTAGGEERHVTSYTSPATYVRYPDWSPLGDRIAYEYGESTSTVWVTNLPPAGAPP